MSKTDTYRWLEKDSKRTQKWIGVQEKQTNKYFRNTRSRNILKKQFKDLLDVDVEHVPVVRDKKYFFRRRKRGEDQASLFLKHGLKGEPILLINPSDFRFGTIQNWCVSKDAKYIAIDFSLSSNDRHIIKIFDVIRKRFLKDTITSERYPYFQTWNSDSSGFWYAKGENGHSIAEEKYYKRIYYHILGQLILEDKLFFGKDLIKDDRPNIACSHDGRYQIITVYHNANRTTTVYFRDTQYLESNFINITKNIKALSSARAEDGFIYLFTDHNAPNCKILRRKIMLNSLDKWEVFVPESKSKLDGYVLLKNYLALEYIENVSSKVYMINLEDGKKVNIKLPSLGFVGSYGVEYEGNELFFNFSSLNIPNSIYRLNLKTLKQELYWKPKLKLPANLSLSQEWTTSKDGTKIPMFILKMKDNRRISPTLVYAYGGFGISILPKFRGSVIPFIENGGIFILANIRGGGEFGKKWHEAVVKNKQHKRFEDFAAVLKHLVDQKYTIPEKLSIWGGSNGGLLMSVMALRYPKLFKVALIEVPVTDMLRFHLFHGGRLWFHDYGDPSNKKMSKYLLSYSPYHNVGRENYPAMMITTAEHDDRVHPMHAYKFFAKLQANKNQTNSLLLKIEKQAGHGGADKLKATINKLVDTFSFLYKELDLKV
ncbi:MAG: prolyl oligopeptidase family serine peptidase [bacterium]|nr:prolyl oligopeptidase family serine peptidase [bacterium]MDZ4205851.1 prolyl oligopeptidase family serine peptidase [Patescibacteria group bacterium]